MVLPLYDARWTIAQLSCCWGCCRTFCFFTVVYYWHIGRDKSAANVPNIAGFAFMW